MNQFHLTGKILHVGKPNDMCCGITIIHYPDSLNDPYFDLGMVMPLSIYEKYDFRQYDYIEVKGHYATINKTIDPKKAKLINVIDEIVTLEHE